MTPADRLTAIKSAAERGAQLREQHAQASRRVAELEHAIGQCGRELADLISGWDGGGEPPAEA